jgi:hypothetical protein
VACLSSRKKPRGARQNVRANSRKPSTGGPARGGRILAASQRASGCGLDLLAEPRMVGEVGIHRPHRTTSQDPVQGWTMEVKFRDEGTAQKGSQQWADGRVGVGVGVSK